LLRGRLVDPAGLRAELHIYGFALDLVGPLPVRAMALRGGPMARATGLPALHSPFQDGSLTEAAQLLELLAELAKALGVAIRGMESRPAFLVSAAGTRPVFGSPPSAGENAPEQSCLHSGRGPVANDRPVAAGPRIAGQCGAGVAAWPARRLLAQTLQTAASLAQENGAV
jgi:hypothetical protein